MKETNFTGGIMSDAQFIHGKPEWFSFGLCERSPDPCSECGEESQFFHAVTRHPFEGKSYAETDLSVECKSGHKVIYYWGHDG